MLLLLLLPRLSLLLLSLLPSLALLLTLLNCCFCCRMHVCGQAVCKMVCM